MYSFSPSSKEALKSCHEDLQKILCLALWRSKVDFGISTGHRSPETQKELFKKGRIFVDGQWVVVDEDKVITNADGYIKKSNHNYLPSLAADIFAYVPGKPSLTYDMAHMSYLAGVMQSVALELLDKGNITHHLTWGANWDNDGELIYDHTLKDTPHFELQKID